MSERRPDIVVVGAGAAGLSVAATLRERGLPVLVLDQAGSVGSSWRSRYDRLVLNSSRSLSRLPGLRYRSDGHWPSRDEVVAYLERFAERHGIDLLFRTRVERIDRAGDGWTLDTTRGSKDALHVVVATGPDRVPFLPAWPGREGFGGELIHSSRYRNASPFAGRDMLVVGGGDSAGDIAVDLVEGGASRVRMSIRTPPFIFRGSFAGIPADWFGIVAIRIPPSLADALTAFYRRITVGDLTSYGLLAPPRGFFARNREMPISGILDRSGFVRMVKAGAIRIVAAVERFDADGVQLADGSRIHPDAVVAATGYRPELEPLIGHLGVLDQRGFPRVHPPQTHPEAPGLHLFGFRYTPVGNLRQLRLDAPKLAGVIARDSRLRRV